MEILTLPMAEVLAEGAQADNEPLEEQEMDILAFELWHRANSPELAAAEDSSGEEETRRGRASCL